MSKNRWIYFEWGLSLGINVPRRRFLPVKTTSDLLLVMSNLFTLNRGNLVMNAQRSFPSVPLVKLGTSFNKVNSSRHYSHPFFLSFLRSKISYLDSKAYPIVLNWIVWQFPVMWHLVKVFHCEYVLNDEITKFNNDWFVRRARLSSLLIMVIELMSHQVPFWKTKSSPAIFVFLNIEWFFYLMLF